MCKLSVDHDHEEPNFYYVTQDAKENFRKFSWNAGIEARYSVSSILCIALISLKFKCGLTSESDGSR